MRLFQGLASKQAHTFCEASRVKTTQVCRRQFLHGNSPDNENETLKEGLQFWEKESGAGGDRGQTDRVGHTLPCEVTAEIKGVSRKALHKYVPPSAFWYWIFIVIPAVVAGLLLLLLCSRPLLLCWRGAANPLCPGGQDLDTQKPLPPWKNRRAPGGRGTDEPDRNWRPPNSEPQSREEDGSLEEEEEENRSQTPAPLLGHRAGELDE
nr:PREDICTED: uncharacterized protein LOC107076062 [Lepisosteus oculatus]